MQRNRQILTERFAAILFTQQPQSLLDLACGGGWLLDLAAERGLPALGIEAGEETVREVRTLGHAVLRADVERVPLADDSVDWVAFRHGAHHLARPQLALSEAWRIARRGVVVAEPHHEPQSDGLAFDRWLKRHENRRGMIHGENLSADQLRAPLVGATRIEEEIVRTGRRYRLEDAFRLAQRASGTRVLSLAEQTELDRLTQLAAASALPLPSSVIVTAYK